MLVLIGVLGMPLVATAEESAQQAPSQERTRSMARTWGGVAMIAGGSILATAREEVCFAVVGFGVAVGGCETTWHKPLGFTGIGVAAAGVLLATVWSDVPVMRNMTVVPKRGGVQVGASFRF